MFIFHNCPHLVLSCNCFMCVEGAQPNRGPPLVKTAVYFHAVYLPNLHSLKLRNCVFFLYLKQNMSSIGPTSVLTALSGFTYPHPVSLFGSREGVRGRGLNVEACSCFDHISVLCSALQYNLVL